MLQSEQQKVKSIIIIMCSVRSETHWHVQRFAFSSFPALGLFKINLMRLPCTASSSPEKPHQNQVHALPLFDRQ